MELGRQVRRGEQGIKILVPFKRKAMIAEDGEEDDVIVKGFGLGMVFDVAQTDGDPLPDPPAVERIGGASDRGMRLFVDLLDYLELQNVPVQIRQNVCSRVVTVSCVSGSRVDDSIASGT
jgi:hypothetical protein